MSFVSLTFIIFFIISLLLNVIIQRFFNNRINNIYLLAINYLFYAYWDYRFCLLLLLTTLITFLSGKNTNKKIWYLFGLLFPIVTLCLYKYFDFFLSIINVNAIDIVVPIGISFYTFESISYVVDVHSGKIEAENDFVLFATYISFFPNIVSGPIERSNKLLKQIKDNKKITYKGIEEGLQIMVLGYFKKMVIADRLNLFVSNVYDAPSQYSSLTILLSILSYSIQIYMDFSGYSDIAIGCAKCFGYNLERNFNLPYISRSITEFWRRWHISLSTWFKDYVYIPLGGNRKGKFRQYFNLIIVMTLSGLWHGASWNYVLWGFINGLILCIEKPFIKKSSDNLISNILRTIITFVIISFTWVIFRAESVAKVTEIFKYLFMFKGGINQPYEWSFIAFGIVVLTSIYFIFNSKDKKCINVYYIIQSLDTIKGLTIFFIFVGLILCLAYANTNPFVYFQF